MIKIGSLFSGIGGFELGIERAIPGSSTIWQVEQNEFCQRVLKKHWPNATIYNDVKNINKNNVEPVDILLGGFPCQDLSLAGKGAGIHEGKKSSLYWEMWRIIGELRPRIVVMENVPAITFRGLDAVLGSLSQIGYDAEWCIISAREFGAPHLRRRWFCVAYPNGIGCRSGGDPESEYKNTLDKERNPSENKQSRQNGIGWIGSFCETTTYPNAGRPRSHGQIQTGRDAVKTGNSRSHAADPNGIGSGQTQHRGVTSNVRTGSKILAGRSQEQTTKKNYWQRFPTQPPLCNRNDGIPDRLAKLRSLGNAIVPQCSQWIGEQILKSGLLEGIDHEG